MSPVSATVPLSRALGMGQRDSTPAARDNRRDSRRDTARKPAAYGRFRWDTERDNRRDSNEKHCPTAGKLAETGGTVRPEEFS